MKRILSFVLVLILSLGALAACQNPQQTGSTYDLDNAKAMLIENYSNLMPTKEIEVPQTLVDFTVVKILNAKDGKYTVAWSTDNEAVKVVDYVPGEDDIFTAETAAIIDVPSLGANEVAYKLTAKITTPDGKSSTEVVFNLLVPSLEYNTHDEYMAAETGDNVAIKGIVAAINSKSAGNKYNHIFVVDESGKGGYYCYQTTQDPIADLGIQVGMTVLVSGPVEPYYGMQELKGGQIVVLDTSIKTVAPYDATEEFANGADFGNYVGMPVVIKGVEIGTQDLSTDTSQYLYFSLNGKTGYVRTYVTDFPAGMLTADDKDTIDADHAAHFGWKADVTGIVVLYNGSPYLIPMSVTPFTNYEEIVKTPAEKVEAEKESLKLGSSFSSDTVIDLMLKGQYYSDVTITWATDNDVSAAIADGKLTLVVGDEEVIVKITATITCEDVTATKEFEIKLSKAITPIKEAIEIGAAMDKNTYTDEKYIIAGIISDLQNDQYGNMIITDENGDSILVYGTFINGQKYGEAEGYKPKEGDYVVVMGVVGKYNDPQLKNADILSYKTLTSGKDVNEIGSAQEHNTYTEEEYLVVGVITEISNDKYGNMYIEDLNGDKVYVYGLYNQVGDRFDAFATKPAVGDVVAVIGAAGQYNGSPQLKNATIVGYEKAEEDDGGDEDVEVITTIPAALEAEVGAAVILKGTVVEFYYEWNDQYGNCSVYIQDEAGNKILAFRLATKVALGDIITVSGTIAEYSGTNQIAEGCTAVIEGSSEVDPDPDPDTDVEGATSLTVGQGYKVTANNANGPLWFSGTITKGRFDCSVNEADAILVYVEETTDGYLLYMNVESTKTYINMNDEAAGALTTTNATEATVYEWNATLNTLMVADDDNARAFGAQNTSTYTNFSSYATSNTSGYNWGQFIPAN